MDEDAYLLDPASHFEALALMAASRLTGGDAGLAFKFADRRCRSLMPNARDFLMRAEASRVSGYADYATKDLAKALELDPDDVLVNRSVLRSAGSSAREGAALRLISNACSDAATLKLAIETMLLSGRRICRSLLKKDGRIVGWLAWASQGPVRVVLRSESRDSECLVFCDESHGLASSRWSAAAILLEDDPTSSTELSFFLGGQLVDVMTIAPPPRAIERKPKAEWRAHCREAAPAMITIIVPVFDDYESTKLCIDSLYQILPSLPNNIIVINDGSNNKKIIDYIKNENNNGKLKLITNDSNLGYARSINIALNCCVNSDVLLVNSDTILPPTAVEGLVNAAYSDKLIGTVTPLSNNGEFTSFPKPNEANPLPPVPEILHLADAAAAANGFRVVDLPNGIGFCLYIKEACLASVGFLPELYSRGYFEDVEFCLRAAEKGFRNVCATGVFVGHAGSRSFKAEKRALVVRNRAIIEVRFPDYRSRCTAFLEVDPLMSARSAIELQSPPTYEAIMICSPTGEAQAAAEMRSQCLDPPDRNALLIYCVFDPLLETVRLRAEGAQTPQSLQFSLSDPSDVEAMNAYLRQLNLRRIEVLDPAHLPSALMSALYELDARVELICADAQWFLPEPITHQRGCLQRHATGPCIFCQTNALESATWRERPRRQAPKPGERRVDEGGRRQTLRSYGGSLCAPHSRRQSASASPSGDDRGAETRRERGGPRACGARSYSLQCSRTANSHDLPSVCTACDWKYQSSSSGDASTTSR